MSTRLLLTYANQKDNLLEHLRGEYVGVEEIIDRSGYPVYMDPHADNERIVKKLIEYRDSLELFSYSGHVGGGYLITEGHTTNPEGIAGLLKDCPNIKVVLLNGCGTKDQVKMLKAAGVPVVIYTHTSVYDELAKIFATTFFASLLNGENLYQAFTDAKNAVNTAKDINSPIQFQQTRGLELDDIEDEKWGIYPEEGTDLNWTLDFISEFRNPIYKKATKLMFIGDDKEGKKFYQRIKGAFVQEESNREYILNGLWRNGDQIIAPSAVDEIKVADTIILLANGLEFSSLWQQDRSLVKILGSFCKPWILINITGGEIQIDNITKDIGMYSAFLPKDPEAFAYILPSGIERFILKTLIPDLKQSVKLIKEGKIPHDKLNDDLYEFDLDTPTTAFKKVLQEKRYFHLVFLEGTPQCGLELLVRRFRAYISDLDHNPKIISFLSANGAIITKENLFKEISQYLELKGENDIDDVATALRLELKKSQLVFILDNVIHPKMDQAAVHNNLETVNQLWATICNELGKKDVNQFKKLFILVLNRDYCEHKQFKSLPIVDNINAIAAFIPPIERVKTQDILEWYDRKRFKFFDSKFDLIEQHLDEITGDGFLASVLHRLCEKIECKEVYANLKLNDYDQRT